MSPGHENVRDFFIGRSFCCFSTIYKKPIPANLKLNFKFAGMKYISTSISSLLDSYEYAELYL